MRIGIIGGSSQVGSSLALYFKHFSNTDVVCFVRSTYSTIFFELFDIAFDKIDFNDSEKLQQQFQGLDAVIDCSYPAVQLYDILPAIRRNLNAIITAMPESARTCPGFCELPIFTSPSSPSAAPRGCWAR